MSPPGVITAVIRGDAGATRLGSSHSAGRRRTPRLRVLRRLSVGDTRGTTQGVDAEARASARMRRRVASIKRVSASNLRKRGTTLVTTQRQRSSKRVILGQADKPCGTARGSDDR